MLVSYWNLHYVIYKLVEHTALAFTSLKPQELSCRQLEIALNCCEYWISTWDFVSVILDNHKWWLCSLEYAILCEAKDCLGHHVILLFFNYSPIIWTHVYKHTQQSSPLWEKYVYFLLMYITANTCDLNVVPGEYLCANNTAQVWR